MIIAGRFAAIALASSVTSTASQDASLPKDRDVANAMVADIQQICVNLIDACGSSPSGGAEVKNLKCERLNNILVHCAFDWRYGPSFPRKDASELFVKDKSGTWTAYPGHHPMQPPKPPFLPIRPSEPKP